MNHSPFRATARNPEPEFMDKRIMSEHYVYILANPSHTVIYIGMTSNIFRRVEEHQMKVVEGFTKRYNCIKLVYIEVTPDRLTALTREKELKKWSRIKKTALITSQNPTWQELTDKINL